MPEAKEIDLEKWSQVQGWMKACCDAIGVEYNQVMDKKRSRQYVEYRQLFWMVLRKRTGLSYNNIGMMFRRDHTTIIAGINHIREILDYDTELQKIHDEFKRQYNIIFQ